MTADHDRLATLNEPPSYLDLVEQHNLTLLRKGGDLVLTESGDLALTKDGDLRMGSVAHNALMRLVQAWRYNAPSMHLMFLALCDLRDREDQFHAQLETTLGYGRRPGGVPLQETIKAYHSANDAIGSAVIGRGALAGSIMVVASSLLSRFKDDLGPIGREWKGGQPLAGGYSVGEAVVAAANSFRHHDEWLKAYASKQIKPQQRKSIDILIAVLEASIPRDLLGDVNASERLLLRLSTGKFSQFEAVLLGYANEVATQVELGPEAEKQDADV